MIDMYGDYIFEKFGKEIITTDFGFVTYLADKIFYIEDIYIDPKFRHKANALDLGKRVENIAREKGFKEVYGSVSIHSKTATRAMRILIDFGYTLHSLKADLIYLKKDI